ncbi:MAG: hypothetical protein QM703_07065 [Gemmatales bacterium]
MIRFLFIIGVVLLALSGWLYYDSLPPPLCTFNTEEIELFDAKPETEHEVRFTLTNPTNEMVKIVGLADC